MMNRLLTFLILSILILSCKKQEIKDPPIGNNPVFRASGSIGNESYQFVAGDNNCSMETGILNINGIKNYFGNFNSGENQLKIVFKDGLMNQSLIESLGNSINICSFPNSNQVTLSKNNMPNSYLIETIDWYVNGSYAGLNEITLNESGIFDVCAHVKFTDNSIADVCNEIILGYTCGTQFQLRHFLSGDGELKVWIDESNEDVSSVDWYLDEQWIGSNEDLEIDINEYAHTLRAEVLFENGSKRTRSIWIDGSLQGKYIDDFASVESNWQGPNQDFSAQIFLNWNDKAYISIHNEQSQDFFTIESVTPYGLNEAGKSVIKIHGVISCGMQDVETGSISPFECEVDFALQVD